MKNMATCTNMYAYLYKHVCIVGLYIHMISCDWMHKKESRVIVNQHAMMNLDIRIMHCV